MFLRRLGPDPHANGAKSVGGDGCPDIWELDGGDFAADHADGQDDIAKPEGKELGLSVLPLPPQMIDDLRVKLQVWNPPRGSEPQRTDDGRSGDLRSLPQLHDLT